ncbi:MAG TPA: hypothetical protein VFC68_00840 [Treponemataceae bacterium]|nr:hypothetical protein [Treponemataceae bacterium]
MKYYKKFLIKHSLDKVSKDGFVSTYARISTYAVIFLSLFFLCTACSLKGASGYSMLEDGVKNPTTIDEYENAIAAHDKQIEKIIELESKTGIWYKIIATRYLDKKMYGKALENFQIAIQYYPDNANLFYYTGLCASYMAKASLDFDADGTQLEQQSYWNLAENSYLQAINYNPTYSRALYGLGVLYVFELNRPSAAIPFLETLLEGESKHFDGMMVLARAYFVTGFSDNGIALYDRIISNTSNKEQKTNAENNKKIVLNELYKN